MMMIRESPIIIAFCVAKPRCISDASTCIFNRQPKTAHSEWIPGLIKIDRAKKQYVGIELLGLVSATLVMMYSVGSTGNQTDSDRNQHIWVHPRLLCSSRFLSGTGKDCWQQYSIKIVKITMARVDGGDSGQKASQCSPSWLPLCLCKLIKAGELSQTTLV
jgi:hypothetical protein